VSKQRITSTTQSPMNPYRLLVTLACGHEVWVTRRGTPRLRTMACVECAARPAPASGEVKP